MTMDEQKFRDMLKNEGMKNTRHRNAILEILAGQDNAVTVDDIYFKLKEGSCRISLSTVYRTLDMLVARGLVQKSLLLEDSRTRYELKRHEHRHCLVCVKCNRQVAIGACPLEALEKQLVSDTDFTLVGHRLEVYGYCPECRARQ